MLLRYSGTEPKIRLLAEGRELNKSTATQMDRGSDPERDRDIGRRSRRTYESQPGIEALLFAAQKPLAAREIVAAIKGAGGEDELMPNEFAKTTEAQVAAALEQLKIEYGQQGRAFQLAEKAEGWQLVSDPAYAPWVRQLFPAVKPARLTPPSLETLAIIAYRQPITRADVEAVRAWRSTGAPKFDGARAGEDRRRAEVPGRPLPRGLTQFFLGNISDCAGSDELRTRRNCAPAISRQPRAKRQPPGGTRAGEPAPAQIDLAVTLTTLLRA